MPETTPPHGSSRQSSGQVKHPPPRYAPSPKVLYGLEHYRCDTDQRKMLVDELIEGYRSEGIAMPYTMEEFRKDYLKKHLKELTPQEFEEALAGMTREQFEEIERVLCKVKSAARSEKQKPPRKRK